MMSTLGYADVIFTDLYYYLLDLSKIEFSKTA